MSGVPPTARPCGVTPARTAETRSQGTRASEVPPHQAWHTIVARESSGRCPTATTRSSEVTRMRASSAATASAWARSQHASPEGSSARRTSKPWSERPRESVLRTSSETSGACRSAQACGRPTTLLRSWAMSFTMPRPTRASMEVPRRVTHWRHFLTGTGAGLGASAASGSAVAASASPLASCGSAVTFFSSGWTSSWCVIAGPSPRGGGRSRAPPARRSCS